MAQIVLHLDFETASRINLKERGLDNYAKDPSTKVLMLAWCINDQLPEVWFPHERPFPEHLEQMIRRPEIQKSAFNAEFERTIFRHVLKINTQIQAWDDPMINARYASIAGDLAYVGKILGIEEDKAKLAAGKKLIGFFCAPNKKGEFNDWNSHPEKWAEFVEYCKRDVIAEREIGRKLRAFELPPKEKKIFYFDQKMNERGLPIDMTFVSSGVKIVNKEYDRLTSELHALTGLENPNSRDQLVGWLKDNGYPYGSIAKDWVVKALEGTSTSPKARQALELRQQLSKSSVAKLETIANVVGSDGYLRYQYVYGGAARTLRWSGRKAQPQNFKRGSFDKFDEAVEAIRQLEQWDDLSSIREFGNPLDVVSDCIKAAIRAPKGKTLNACDLATIEVRVLGWMTGCSRINKVFEEGRDPYKDFGTHFYKKPYEEITKAERQVCKPAVLQCGYQAGGGELKKDKNGDVYKSGLWGYAEEYGVDMTQEEAAAAVALYRDTYPEVKEFWRKCENASIAAVRTGEQVRLGPLVFGCVKPGKLLWVLLPSGRRLHYIRPRLETVERYDGSERTILSYEGQITGKGKFWGRKDAYGGLWTENFCQAIARDAFAEGALSADAAGFSLIGLTHDELIDLEDENSNFNLAALREHMIKPLSWAPDLLLDADGWTDKIYRKE